MHTKLFENYLITQSITDKAINTRIRCALKVEDILHESLDTIVSDDKKMYDTLQKIRPFENPKNRPLSNALRKYYEAVNGKSFLKLKSYKPATKVSDPILDEDQEHVYELLEKSDKSLFITGKAGTGKSFLIKYFIEHTNKNVLRLGPTGLSARNIDGYTIDSIFGFNPNEYKDYNGYKPNKAIKDENKVLLKNADVIIIDEISMVRCDVLDKIAKALKVINKTNKNVPFGNKRLIITGDLFQLPPILKKDSPEYKQIAKYYKHAFPYFFDSYECERNPKFFTFVELTISHRNEEDKTFYETLNNIREGKITQNDLNFLNQRVVAEPDSNSITLFPTKDEASNLNNKRLDELNGKKIVFKADIYPDDSQYKDKIEHMLPIDQELNIKTGAKIIFVCNDTNKNKRWVNGDMGTIIDINVKNEQITIKHDNGKTFIVKKIELPIIETEFDDKNWKFTNKKIAIVKQFPIKLAYAISIHKSQGMTYERINCSLKECFADGQAYVALSRCRTLNGLHLLEKIDADSIKVNNRILEEYNSLINNKHFIIKNRVKN